MPSFTDTQQQEWSIDFDAVLLKELRGQTGINLYDITAGGYARIELDMADLIDTLCVLCGPQYREAKLSRQQFAARLTGETLDAALQAIWRAAELFFPARQMSALSTNFAQQIEAKTSMALVPEGMLGALASSASQQSATTKSATGQAVAPSSVANGSPDTLAVARGG